MGMKGGTEKKTTSSLSLNSEPNIREQNEWSK